MRGIFWLFTAAAFLYCGAEYRFHFFIVLGFALFAVAFVMLMQAIRRRNGIEGEEWQTAHETERGLPTGIPLPVKRKRKLPRGRLRFRLAIREGEEKKRKITFASDDRGDPPVLFLTPRRTGFLRIELLSLAAEDALGLFRIRVGKKTAGGRILLAVFPPARSGEEDDPGRGAEEGPPARRRLSGGEETEIREYRPGDPARRIHWALSARTGTPYLREETGEEMPVRLLELERLRKLYEEDREAFFEKLAGEIADAGKAGAALEILTGDGEERLVTNPEEGRSFFLRLFEKEEAGKLFPEA